LIEEALGLAEMPYRGWVMNSAEKDPQATVSQLFDSL